MDVFRMNAPEAHSSASTTLIGNHHMINQEIFADYSDNSGISPGRGKQRKEVNKRTARNLDELCER
jgi:hypothetical protein